MVASLHQAKPGKPDLTFDWWGAIYAANKLLGMGTDDFFRLTPVGFTELLRAASGKRRNKAKKVDNVDQIPGGW